MTVGRQPLPAGGAVRVSLAARDVSLTLEKQTGTSILNIFPAAVDELLDDGAGQVTARLKVGRAPLLARITRKSAVELELQPGSKVFAQVKSIALLT